MSKRAYELFNGIIESGSSTDIEILEQVLNGISQKQIKKQTYINLLLGLDTELTSDSIRMTLPISSLIHNSLGIVHGGIITTLADTAMGTLANTIIPADKAAVTTEIQVHFLKQATGNKLVCECSILHKGKKTMVFDSKIYREDGTLCGHSTASFFIVPKN